MITNTEADFFKAQQLFQTMCEFIQKAGEQGFRVDQVERELFPQAMHMCLELLGDFINAHGDGDEGKQIPHEGRSLNRLPQPHERRYLSIFGEIVIDRYVYGTREGQAIEWVPLDAALGLPAGENSYVLEDWLQRLCVKEAYGESVDDLRAWLGTTVSVRTAEGMNRKMAALSEGYRIEQGTPPPGEEAEILVVTADGKGVPMRRSREQRVWDEQQVLEAAVSSDEEFPTPTPASSRPKTGKTGKKQMAYVGGVYSIQPFVRTAEEVLEEVRRKQRAKDRPDPVHKQLWARMTTIQAGEVWPGTPLLFIEMARAVQARDPDRQKSLVCLLDGERQLWTMQQEWFPRAVGILDLFHVLKRVWTVAEAVHPKESLAAEDFVTHHLRMLLEGKVGYVIRNFRRLKKTHKHRLRGQPKKQVEAAITYLENNRAHMHYDEYLSAGYPIASGVIEGACHHFVKDRMEGAGMRWEIEGAQSMLSLRAIYLNDQWDAFIAYRIETEQTRLYGKTPQRSVAL